ncbi:ventricular zone-expressed PH domain-containing protein homolog 1 isoform X1 [Alligator sinensis]|uniref:Ventricular zone-expressed PH domain-containing protein homolog 1 isoform X1 n=1 Tax=Alligator sinensis TaxID=38654 RepID=A0A1U7RPA9_ALLSI|nr:ventricular zone-expressed PH domain-containing protein homolog 1 isoform X1 [Alligator sinensis]XP_025070728.1 ventricular zone-expressed PH domain-containing protein homolog 1 isoform X1 [Alligator sinensis]XP_025070732.1 ventricular zone-expressed PH domain-containing protein homolog 1 isoform X1 [Alligator sinensis]XP_025070734.1 ventricular zone-expressed PH domain-containing protein homolog 1 isoform X1 [Alligator sinensis]XP_025070737.1 ventricular zone-expressed PH domain-containing 
MHHLFGLVLGQKDLSRAGDLFSLDDAEIEGSLSEALEQIRIISSSSDYQTNDNDQAVVEICITRITTAIRETESIEKHGKALVALWESCLEHKLKPSGKDEDTPHAKIASDIMSCILQNYNRPPIMALAVPVAVRFLQRGNKELCRNMSSYLSLAAISNVDLLVDHTDAIVKSVLQGNSMLLRVLPSLYEKQPQSINSHLKELVALMSQLEQAEQHHLLRVFQVVARRKQPEVLKECIPFLISHLRDPHHNDIILNILIEISDYEPVALASSLPMLKEIGESFPSLIGQMSKIFGAVGHLDEERARICLVYLVNQLANMEHSSHHILLLEIKSITDTFSNILSTQSRDIYRMSNSFTAIAKLLIRQLENDNRSGTRIENYADTESSVQLDDLKPVMNGNEENEKLQVKIQAFEEKISIDNNTPGSVRRYSVGQFSKEERKEMRFNRSKSLAFHAIRTKVTNSDSGQDIENGDMTSGISFTEIYLNQENDKSPFSIDTEEAQPDNSFILHPNIKYPESENLPESLKETSHERSTETVKNSEEYQDKLYMHLKENLSKVKAYLVEIGKKIPIPDQCVIEDTVRSCVAKLFFSCPLKGHYCLYSKSSFTLISRQPQLWIHIMFLFQQSLFPEPLSIQSNPVQVLKALWEKTQLKGTHSFENTMIQSTFPHQKDLDHVRMHLEEVRFFDLFGYSEETGTWQCFMCNNPEKATVVNQDGQPLIEGKLKEKQVRWKFIKRWKTRYFTLAGNQLLFRKGKSKDDPDDCPIELSKVQSVKVVAKKRRDRSLPRAFEIFTDNKTYVFKAKDEKNAEEWLQCINVAVAQAKERESREATTYL